MFFRSYMSNQIIVPYAMLWLKKRLKELDKSGAEFGRTLGIPKERVYEMYRGIRRLQLEEIGKAARFLGWSEAELLAHIEGRPSNAKSAVQIDKIAVSPDGDITLPPLVLYRTAIATNGLQGGVMLYAEKVDEVPRPFFLKFSTKAFAAKILDDTNEPVYRRWDTILIDPRGNLVAEEDGFFTAYPEAPGGAPSMIGRLISSTDTHWSVHLYGPNEDIQLPRTIYPNAWPIVGRYNRR